MTSAIPVAAPRLLREPSSPFVRAAEREQALDELLPERSEGGLVELVRDPDEVAKKLVAIDTRQAVVLTSLLGISLGTGVFAATVMAKDGAEIALKSAILLSFNTLMGLAAALGPIYATSILVAARLPLGRLAAVMLASAAAGSLVLAASAPVTYLAFRASELWLGPISLSGSFVIGGIAAGVRVHGLLFALARELRRDHEGTVGLLSEGERFRLGILARMSLAIGALTSALAFWAFDLFSW